MSELTVPTYVLLGSAAPDPRSRGIGRAVAIVAGLVAVASLLWAVRGPDADPPRFAPTYLPELLDSNRSSWTFRPVTSYDYGVDYGRRGADGRLDRWIQIRSTSETMGEESAVVNGRSIWYFPGPASELRAVIDRPDCGRFRFTAAWLDRQATVDALAHATCDHGYPVIVPFDGMRSLCRTSASMEAWAIHVQPAVSGAAGSATLSASHDGCPVETYSGTTFGSERFVEIDGRRTLVFVSAEYGQAVATFRVDGYRIQVTLDSEPRAEAALVEDIERVVHGLERLDLDRWRQLTGQ